MKKLFIWKFANNDGFHLNILFCYLPFMIKKLNEKFCNKNNKVICNVNAKRNTSRYYQFLFVTVLTRYFFPFLVFTIYMNPFMGILGLSYPFSQINPFYYIYHYYLIDISSIDTIMYCLGFVIMIVYYFYVFRELGFYSFIQFTFSLLMSIIMIFITNIIWGMFLMSVKFFVSILIDIQIIKKMK